ncbi:MAG: hypothetical protein NC048_10045 [Bacteroides sp.]|nr:hypothetical protein [Bacteroides sp.]MCM1555815.1 hypothetical protein [Bacteroides sp.]
MQGKDRLFIAEAQENLQERKKKTLDKLDETLSELEKTIVEDVYMLEPKERVSLYVKLLKFVIPTAQAEAKGKSVKDEAKADTERFSIFGNVLNASRGAEA